MTQLTDAREATDTVSTAAIAAIGVTAVVGLAVAGAAWFDNANQVPSVVYLLCGFVTAVIFLTWLWRARVAAEASGTRQRLARGWTIGAWFTPVANLMLPLLVVEDVTGKRTLARTWWGLLIAATAVKLITGTTADDPAASAIRTENIGITVSALLVAAAGVLLAKLVRQASPA
jgi:lysylphosphatidylglycerol synthetase-like protein (DUF2156 family)